MTVKTIFIGVKDPHLSMTLSSRSTALGLNVIGRSDLGGEIMRRLQQEQPDFAILEERPAVIGGFDIVKKLKDEGLRTRFIFFLPQQNPNLIRKAFYSKVSSIIFAADGITELAECFSALGILDTNFTRKSTDNSGELKSDSAQDLLNTLTPCQLKILTLVIRHMTMPEIAKELYISRHTVNNHIANIRKRLQLKGRGVVLKYALANQHRLSEIELQLNYNSMAYNA